MIASATMKPQSARYWVPRERERWATRLAIHETRTKPPRIRSQDLPSIATAQRSAIPDSKRAASIAAKAATAPRRWR